MLERLKDVLSERCQLDADKTVLAGVSGGADSLCLLDVLCRLEYPVVVAHLNHKLRPEADADANMVRTFAEQLGLQFVIEASDVGEYAKAHSLSVEEAARVLRYQFLFDKAGQFAAQAVAVGHNADDQAETVLMHILRGSGLAGLRGMGYRTLPNPWSQKIPLVRPLLGFWREEIETYLGERGLEPVLDRSNLDTTYARNRLRYALIPLLETYNQKVRKALWQLGEVAGGDYTLLEDYTHSVWGDMVRQQGEGFIAFDHQYLQEASLATQRNILRQAIAALLGDVRDIDYATVRRATDYLNQTSPGGICDLKAGLKMFAEGDTLWLVTADGQAPSRDWPQVVTGSPISLDIPGSATLAGGWVISCDKVVMDEDLGELIYANSDPFQAWIDAERISSPLQIRTRAPGDRFQPLGMVTGSKKLSDFMINNHLPERLRDGWPLLCAGDDILWLPGYRINHRYRVTDRSRWVLQLKTTRPVERNRR